MAAHDMTTEKEDCFTRLPPKRRWKQTTWFLDFAGAETTSTDSVDPHYVGSIECDRHVEEHMIMMNSQNIEFDGIVQMDIEAHTLTLG